VLPARNDKTVVPWKQCKNICIKLGSANAKPPKPSWKLAARLYSRPPQYGASWQLLRGSSEKLSRQPCPERNNGWYEMPSCPIEDLLAPLKARS
jgi:hypothetical protein